MAEEVKVTDQTEYLKHLTESPIADFAKFAGIGIDEAVKRRVEAAVEAAPPKMDISVRPIEPQGNLLGFAKLKIGGVTVDEFKIMENKTGELFVGMPSRPDRNNPSGYRATVFIDKSLRAEFTQAAIDKYRTAVERAQDIAGKLKPAPIKEQMEKAGKEAAQHNAALTSPSKSNKQHGDRT